MTAGTNGAMLAFASGPLGATLSGSGWRNSYRLTISAACTSVMPGTHCLNLQWVNRRIVRPSEIPSRTQSVSAFLPVRGSKGSPLLQPIALTAAWLRGILRKIKQTWCPKPT